MDRDVIVIGAGVTGLSVAQILSKNGYHVTIVAREMPRHRSLDYTSPWAGAIYRPWPAIDDQSKYEADLARTSYAAFKEIALDSSSGVRFVDGFDYFENPSEPYKTLAGGYSDIDDFTVLDESLLPPGVSFGTKYKTWCLNPPVYLQWLERNLVLKGVRCVRRRLNSAVEVFPLFNLEPTAIIVNCSGMGFCDPAVFPTRGQTVIVANPCNAIINQQHEDGDWTYIIPRPLNGGTVIGGTKEKNNWNPHVDPSTRVKLLTRAAKMHPAIITNGLPPESGGFEVITDIVGRRPTRHGGIRLELENIDGRDVIHAYGTGSIGYEISWGVAEDVFKIVRNV